MSITAVVKKNTYFDSVSLMRISTQANTIEGIEQAFVAMGTEMNKAVLDNLNLLDDQLRAAGTGDLMMVVVPVPGLDGGQFIGQIEELLTAKAPTGSSDIAYKTIAGAKEAIPDANLAVIAVNGAFAASEARKALNSGLNVMLFSDNVSVEDEISLKHLAHDKGLLMMGPDCGTAIINNVGLAFSNNVRPGHIGIAAASGTGSQEVSVQIHALGAGISQLIGTGGRDLSAEVGGIMMIDGIRMLAADPNTKVITLVSKPPAPETEAKVLEEIAKAGKPVVVYFIGGDEKAVAKAGGHFAASSFSAAAQAVALLDGGSPAEAGIDAKRIAAVRANAKEGQKYIRGLFCGGTLADESMYALLADGHQVYSNMGKDPAFKLGPNDRSREHSFLDFGEDEFTNGRPHPMIDPSLRAQRVAAEAEDPSVLAIVMDFVLGYGAHEDPVGATIPYIKQAKDTAAAQGRELEIIGYVLGTDADVPSRQAQIKQLLDAGVAVTASSTATGQTIRALAAKEN